MKKMFKVLTVLAMTIAMISGFININSVSAAASKDDSFEVKGNSQVVDVDEIGNEITVKFTFKTDHPDLKGYLGGTQVIKYDPTKMEYIPGSISQSGSLANEGSFNYNGQASVAGEILLNMAQAVGSQNYDLTMKFKNLFKDGQRSPLVIQIIPLTTDPWLVDDGTRFPFIPANPVIIDAKISLSPIDISLNGSNSIQKGQNATYTATVTNTLTNNGVNWSITGANDASTTIDAAGKLTVSKNETASSLIVTATSKEDGTVKKTKTVSLTNPPQLSVAISGKDQIIKGTKGNNYTSTVSNASNKAVTYSLTGQSSAKTTVDATGNITVGIDETASTLSLKATSVEDTTKSSSMTIKVIDKTYTIVKAELPVSKIEMKNGTTEDEFDVEAQKNNFAKVTIKTNDGKQYVIEVPTSKYISDKDVVDQNGILAEGKFNLIYTLDLPNISIDENGTITKKTGKTNIIGKDTKDIPVEIAIKSKVPTIEGGTSDSTNGGANNSTTSGDAINKEVIKNAIKTGDEVNIALYTGMIFIASISMIAIFIYKRKRIEE